MAKIDGNNHYFELDERSGSPGAPESGRSRLYFDSADGHLKYIEDDGSITDLGSSAGSAHDQLHDIDSTDDHNGVTGATENNFVAFDASGLPKDSGKSDASYEDAGAISNHESTYDHVASLGTAAEVDVPASGDAAADEAVKGNDSRLTDSRNPTNHASDHTDGTDDVATMGGASAGAAGSKGLVPAPAAGDEGKFLRGDATWQSVGGGSVAAADVTFTPDDGSEWDDPDPSDVDAALEALVERVDTLESSGSGSGDGTGSLLYLYFNYS